MLEDMIRSYFGISCEVEKTKIAGLALYMTAGREFYMVNMEGLSFLLVKLPSNDRFGAIALDKQRALLKKEMNCEVAFLFERITKLQREVLIEKRIPFVAESDQLYLPFLGIILRNNLKSSGNALAEKMMPATQCLFLYLLYNHKEEYVLKKQAADDLGLTKTSITRASGQLKDMGLITEEVSGKEIHMKTVAVGYELYKAAEPFLVTPVQRRIYVEKTFLCENMLLAGESALSRESMLGEPKHSVKAIYKGDKIVKQFTEVDIKWQESIDAIQLEVWKYNPELFAKRGMVDPVSLALSLADNEDERVQGELEEFMEGFEW